MTHDFVKMTTDSVPHNNKGDISSHLNMQTDENYAHDILSTYLIKLQLV